MQSSVTDLEVGTNGEQSVSSVSSVSTTIEEATGLGPSNYKGKLADKLIAKMREENVREDRKSIDVP